MPWPRPCSNGKPSMPSRSRTSCPAVRRARRRRRPRGATRRRPRRPGSRPPAMIRVPPPPLSDSILCMPDPIQCGRFRLSLERPLVMGIVNVTPDSFSDGNEHFRADEAVAHARLLVEEGADLLDIGGESTRPGAQAVPADEELRRILPVIEALRDCGVPLSVD